MLKYSGEEKNDQLLSSNLRLFRVGDLLTDSFQTYLTMFPPSKTVTIVKERGSNKLKKKEAEEERKPPEGEEKSSGVSSPPAAPGLGGGFGGFGGPPPPGGFGSSTTSAAVPPVDAAAEPKSSIKTQSVSNVRFLLGDLCDPLDPNISLFGHHLVTVDEVLVKDEKKMMVSFWSSTYAKQFQTSVTIENEAMKVENMRLFDFNDAYNVIEESSEDKRDLVTLLAAIEDDEDDEKKNKLVSDHLYPMLDEMANVKDPDKVITLMLGVMEINDIVVLMSGDMKELQGKVSEAVEALENMTPKASSV